MHREWTNRLSEYLDGGLAPDEVARLEAHLDTCRACSTVLGELRAVVLRAQSLDAMPPSKDLWTGIQARIETAGEPDRGQVIDLASRRGVGAPPTGRRTVRLSIPQLAAAAVVLVFASGTTVWLAGPGAHAPTPSGAGTQSGVQAIPAAGPGVAAAEGVPDELAQLQDLLESHREALSPNTVRILEKNLGAIDRAIAESMQALANDPGNEFLQGHLERARQRKLEYLRDASVAFQWST